MRHAVFSDIHGNLAALEAVLADLEQAGGADLIWCLGDLAAFGPHGTECIRRVRGLAEQMGPEKMQVIGGNTDRYLVTGERFPVPPAKDAEALARRAGEWQKRDSILNWNTGQLGWDDYEYLKGLLGRETAVEVPGYGRVIGFHAVPGHDEPMALRPDTSDEEARDALLDREGRLALCGHTHIQMDRDLSPWRVVNPGSVGFSYSNPGRAEWALLRFKGGALDLDLRVVDYDIPAMLADLQASGHPHPEWLTAGLKR